MNKYERETKTLMQRIEKGKKRRRKEERRERSYYLPTKDRYIQDVFKKNDKKKREKGDG